MLIALAAIAVAARRHSVGSCHRRGSTMAECRFVLACRASDPMATAVVMAARASFGAHADPALDYMGARGSTEDIIVHV